MLLKNYYLLFVALLLSCPSYGKDTKDQNQKFFNQFHAIFERVDRDYVQDPDKQKMVDAAINGMLHSLDPHSGYFTDDDLSDFLNQTDGEFGGIGVEVLQENNVVKIISPIDDLPAYKAGIKAGDYIVGVNEDLVANLGFNKALKNMRGEPGTKVKLLVISQNESSPREVTLTRQIVKLNPVKAHLEPGNIAYVRIITFNKNTISELEKKMTTLTLELKKQSAKSEITGIILDLRNNPGGLLNQAVAVTEYFIDSGIVVTTKGRNSANNAVLTANRFAPKAPKVPIIALINHGSASASEIVAGALQDHKRAMILGTQSFGKGSVQTFVQINHRAAVKITTAQYYTPNGRSIQAQGIEPDIVIEPAKVEYATSIDVLKKFSESNLKNSLKNDQETAKVSSDKDIHQNQQLHQSEKNELSELYKKDYQFARAYDLIKALILNKRNNAA